MAASDAVLQAHFPTPEAMGRFEETMRNLKTARYQGAFGQTPEEQSAGVQKYMKQAYPQMFPGEFNPPGAANSPERDAYVQDYRKQHPGPVLDNVPQFLADRGVVEAPKSPMQEYVYPALQGLTEGGLATGGAMLGAASPIPGGAALGAGAGALLSQVIDRGYRYAFGLPQKDLGETFKDAGISVGANMLTESLLSPVSKLLEKFNRPHIFYGDFAPLTPGESSQIDVLGQGSKYAGTYGTKNEAFPSPSALRQGSQGQRAPR